MAKGQDFTYEIEEGKQKKQSLLEVVPTCMSELTICPNKAIGPPIFNAANLGKANISAENV